VQDFIGKQPRRLRIVARHCQFRRNVARQLDNRIALGIERLERLQPVGQRVFQHRDIDVLLAPEIIEQIGLRHLGPRCDLIHRRAPESEGRKDFERRRENDLPVRRLNARSPNRFLPRPDHGPHTQIS
jgi:hypothetical protein